MVTQAQEELWEKRVEELHAELYHVASMNRQIRKELNAAHRELTERESMLEQATFMCVWLRPRTPDTSVSLHTPCLCPYMPHCLCPYMHPGMRPA